jgi:MATE family multidrug resistance protein
LTQVAPPSAPNEEKPAALSTSEELRELLVLSGPLVVSYAGSTLLGFVDTAMVGRTGAEALGAVSMGNSLFFGISLIAMGIVSGMDPLVSQAMGAGEEARARRVLWQGLRVALYLSFPSIALMLALSFGLEGFGIDHVAAVATRSFLYGRAFNVVPFLVAAALRSYLQATGHTRPFLWSVLVANVANFFFNALFIFGDRSLAKVGLPALGLPAMGVFGAGLASSVASTLSILLIVAGVRALPPPPDPNRRALDVVLVKKILSLGVPIGIQLFAEVGVFSIVALLAGRLGKLPVAGHNIALSLASFTFTVTLGIASATGVRVGRAVGREDTRGARRAGFLGLAVGTAFMACAALSFLLFPEPLVRILTNQPDVIAAALPLLGIAAVFQISDGAQVVMVNALRGAGDTKFGQIANLIGHYMIGLPVAIGLGLILHWGAVGLWWGLSAGLTVVGGALILRFNHLSKGVLRRA